jgi:hypothetical protein
MGFSGLNWQRPPRVSRDFQYILDLEQRICTLEREKKHNFPDKELKYGVFSSSGSGGGLFDDNWWYGYVYPNIPQGFVLLGMGISGDEELWINPNNQSQYIYIIHNKISV